LCPLKTGENKMSKEKILPCGSTVSDCDTFEEIAKAFGSVGIALPGRMLKHPQDQEQKQEEDLLSRKRHHRTSQ